MPMTQLFYNQTNWSAKSILTDHIKGKTFLEERDKLKIKYKNHTTNIHIYYTSESTFVNSKKKKKYAPD